MIVSKGFEHKTKSKCHIVHIRAVVNVEDVFVLWKVDGRQCEDCMPSRCENSTAMQFQWNRVNTLRIDYLLILSLILIIFIRCDINISIDSSNNNSSNNNSYNNNENANGICENEHQSSITLSPFTTMSPPTFVWSEKMSGEDFI